jgi:hypothetical protein
MATKKKLLLDYFKVLFKALESPSGRREHITHQVTRTFLSVRLPTELRTETYRLTLLPGNHMISRGHLRYLVSLLYWYNGRLRLLRGKYDDGSVVRSRDYKCRRQTIQHDQNIELIQAVHSAFGLFHTSEEISTISSRSYSKEKLRLQ